MPEGADASRTAPAERPSPAAGRRRFSWRRFRPDGFTIFLLVVSALGAALVAARQATYGLALEWDSINYIAIARNLLDGEFTNFDGTPCTIWPPFYPFLLAVSGLGIVDPLRVAGPLNLLLFAATIFAVGHHLRTRLSSGLLRAWAPVTLALALPLADLARYALTGPVFILLFVLALIETEKFFADGRRARFLFAAVCCSLAFQTRYIGLTAGAAVGLLLLFHPGAPLRARARRLAVFIAIVVGPMIPVVWRNALITGRTEWYRPIVGFDWTRTPGEIGNGLLEWTHFDLSPPFLLLAVPALAAALRSSRSREGTPAAPAGGWRPAAVFGSAGIVYLGLLAFATVMDEIVIQIRYLAPAYPTLLVGATVSLDRLLARERRRDLLGALGGRRLLRALGATGAGTTLLGAAVGASLWLWTAGQVAPVADSVALHNSDRVTRGFHGPPWADYETLRYLRDTAPTGVFYSNLPILVYFHTGGEETYRSLPMTAPSSHVVLGPPHVPLPNDERLARWLETVPEGALVVWIQDQAVMTSEFFSYGRPGLYSLSELTPVAEFVDGAVFRMDRSAPPRPNRYRETFESFESVVSAADGEPETAVPFRVRPGDRTLAYFKTPCREEDTEGNFFLHLYPADRTDLPPRRQRYGFHNLDFRFAEHGVVRDDHCVAVVPLPEGQFTRLRTGQWTPGEGESWSLEIPAEDTAESR